jgi:hypothetical protein
MDAYEIVGWAGAVIVLGAYWLVTKYGTSLLYHALNVLGAGGLLVNALHHDALPSTAVNAVWLLIATWGIALTARHRYRAAAPRAGS